MIHVTVSHDDTCRLLPFYLAMEEWVARNMPPDDYFFTWVVQPTVIIGRHQDVDTEVDLGYCRRNGIHVYRRKSGGGCVYADCSNMMVSYITPQTNVETTFRAYTERVAATLRTLGFDAEVSGRNDVTVSGGKVSGNAFYHLPGRSIAHGTMLFDSDMTHIRHAITPSRAKLESKGVQSVESRITTLRAHRPGLDFVSFRDSFVSGLADSAIALGDEAVKAIERMAEEYVDYASAAAPDTRRRGTLRASRYVPGVGQVAVEVVLDAANNMADLRVTGDFMDDNGMTQHIHDSLQGHEVTESFIHKVLENVSENS